MVLEGSRMGEAVKSGRLPMALTQDPNRKEKNDEEDVVDLDVGSCFGGGFLRRGNRRYPG